MDFSAIRNFPPEQLAGKEILFYTRRTKSGLAHGGLVREVKNSQNQMNILVESAGKQINLGSGTKISVIA